MTSNECCGSRPREVTIDLTRGKLTLLYCGRCERQQWMQDGIQVELTLVTEAASRTWNRKLLAA